MQSSLWPQPTNGLVRPVQVCIGISLLLGVPGTVGSAPGVFLQPSGTSRGCSVQAGMGCALGILRSILSCKGLAVLWVFYPFRGSVGLVLYVFLS